MNHLGINLWNWCQGLDETCIGKPTRAAQLGFTAIELPMTVSDISSELSAEIRDTGLAVTLCAAMGAGRDISNEDPAIRSSTKKYLTECLRNGSKLGAEIFCGPLYAGGGKRHWLSPDEKKAEWERAVDGIRDIASVAADYGIKLALEPINRYRTSVANTSGQIGRAHV